MSGPRPTASPRGPVCSERDETRNRILEYRAGERWSKAIRQTFNKKIDGCVESSRKGRRRRVLKDPALRERIAGSTVLVLTGHHWVESGGGIGEIGGTLGASRNLKLARVMRYSRKNSVVNRSVKLIIVTGCNTLRRRSAVFFSKAFPDALVIGFSAFSTYFKGQFFPNFIKSLPDGLKLRGTSEEVRESQGKIRDAWVAFVEAASKDPKLSKGARGSAGKRQNPAWAFPAYMMPGERVVYWRDGKQRWEKRRYPKARQASENAE